MVRELLLGPQRLPDLRRALPGASSNLLADRLRELSGHGVIRRRRLTRPAACWVYELTDRGRDLEPRYDARLAAAARTHVSRAMPKLSVRDRAQLVVIAYQTGLVQP